MEISETFGAAFGRMVKRRRGEKQPRMTQGDLAAALYPNDSEAAFTRKGDISKLETGKIANPQTGTVTAIAAAVGISPEEIDALRKQVLMSPAQKLENLSDLSRDALELLASRFEIDKPHGLSPAELTRQLSLKAEEYRGYRAEIDNIDDRLKGLGNMKAAAVDAAERLDFEAVEELLLMVNTTELSVAAETTVLRARNALMRGRAQQAYQLLSAAAESFAAVDGMKPVRKRLDYDKILFDHGLRYGGTGLSFAIKMLRDALDRLDEAEQTELWAAAQNNLGLALQTQGGRSGGAAGADLLRQAVVAYRAALRVRSEVEHPVDWARVQNNRGIALQEQGEHSGGAEAADLLQQAVAAYRAALQVRSEAEHPVAWATTQNNLGSALLAQGERSGGAVGADLLQQAVAAYGAALRVYSEAEHPVTWAVTQYNLAVLHKTIAAQDSCEDPEVALRLALRYVEAALRVFEPEHNPFDHDKANELREGIIAALAA